MRPKRFEQIVIDLLVTMGYGGSRVDAGKAIGKTGDQGIDGIIKEDRLGLGVIYVQAKRWGQVIGRPEVQRFAGALAGGILLLGDAIIGNPPGELSLIPEPKLDDPSKLKRSLRKLLDYDFDVLLLCDGQPVLRGGKLKVAEFLNTLA